MLGYKLLKRNKGSINLDGLKIEALTRKELRNQNVKNSAVNRPASSSVPVL